MHAVIIECEKKDKMVSSVECIACLLLGRNLHGFWSHKVACVLSVHYEKLYLFSLHRQEAKVIESGEKAEKEGRGKREGEGDGKRKRVGGKEREEREQ